MYSLRRIQIFQRFLQGVIRGEGVGERGKKERKMRIGKENKAWEDVNGGGFGRLA